MRPVEIKDGIHWVGAVDWNCRNFHGYALSSKGTTYNAFVIDDEKKVLIDTVPAAFESQFLCSVANVTELEKIDYIVVNHLEPDHSGCLARMVELCKPEKIFISPMGAKALKTFFDCEDWPIVVANSGDEISIGKNTLRFYETKMLHWPDNMFTFIPEAKMLVSSDAFGQNWATSERFVDEVSKEKVSDLMAQYYANIVNPYSAKVIKTLEFFGELNLDIDMLCPDHGLMFRGEDVGFALGKYADYAAQKTTNKAVIVYDTMWKSTEKMANAIASGIADEGVSVRMMNVKANHHSDIMSEVFDAGAVILGSPTHNNGILPGMADVLTYMKGLRPQNKIGACFGSFGWSGECVKILRGWLETMNMEIMDPNIKVKNRPNHKSFEECYELGREIAKAVKAKNA
ncbi:FprA family A-type flavoprotein [Maridesulfovibrio frigidus]|uniref:FprA family A-type flavoprotein n=1 Tax=Maridesulfovibrio frigidus TaxID=340956 RepID=UPI0004E1683D|nr:FprA family A-type flavoprotein [Maridesulfovibrio frigidus]